jgi:anti-sigma regulatory factor (Ser/Thr protein kinase)
MRSTQTFEPEPLTVPAARNFVAAALQAWGQDVGDAPLLVSELATNAVLHARSEFTVTMELFESYLRVEVSDGNSRPPVLAHVPHDAYSGRGMALVDALSSSWGVDLHAEQGKTVWFEVALQPLASSTRLTAL